MRTGPGAKRESSTSGVRPTRSRRLGASALASTGHCREEDQRPAVHHGLEAVQRAHVLAAHVDVDERGEVAGLEEVAAERRVPLGEILEDPADVVAARLDLPLAADLGAECRGNPDEGHARTGPAQNSM